MLFLKVLFCALASYLLGSINAGIIVTKLFTGLDLRTQGSGNAGSTNAYRVLGLGPTIYVLLGDALKGIIAVLLCRLVLGEAGQVCAMVFVILGHVHPVFYDFKGGKGVLTTAAMVAVFDWRIFLVMLAGFLIAVLLTRFVSLGSIVGAVLMPPMFYVFYPDNTMYILCALFISLWVIILHKDNVIRLVKGTENKFGKSKGIVQKPEK